MAKYEVTMSIVVEVEAPSEKDAITMVKGSTSMRTSTFDRVESNVTAKKVGGVETLNEG